MRLLLITTSSCCVIALALAAGALRPGLTAATLQRHAERTVAGCLHDAGFDQHTVTVTVAQARTPRDRALERCWSGVVTDRKYRRHGLVDPVAQARRLRDNGFTAWRCTERSGYARTTDIPLSGPDGYPLQLAAGNFRVGSSDRDVERFYRVAAKCSGEPIEAFRWSDGTFSREPADGSRCIRHAHSGSARHAHGCHGAATYPETSGGSQ